MKKLVTTLISAAMIAAPLSVVSSSACAQAAPSVQEGKVGTASKHKAKPMAKAKPKAKHKAKAKHKTKKHTTKKAS